MEKWLIWHFFWESGNGEFDFFFWASQMCFMRFTGLTRELLQTRFHLLLLHDQRLKGYTCLLHWVGKVRPAWTVPSFKYSIPLRNRCVCKVLTALVVSLFSVRFTPKSKHMQWTYIVANELGQLDGQLDRSLLPLFCVGGGIAPFQAAFFLACFFPRATTMTERQPSTVTTQEHTSRKTL